MQQRFDDVSDPFHVFKTLHLLVQSWVAFTVVIHPDLCRDEAVHNCMMVSFFINNNIHIIPDNTLIISDNL